MGPGVELLPAVHRLLARANRLLQGTYQGGSGPGRLQARLDELVLCFNRFNRRAPATEACG